MIRVPCTGLPTVSCQPCDLLLLVELAGSTVFVFNGVAYHEMCVFFAHVRHFYITQASWPNHRGDLVYYMYILLQIKNMITLKSVLFFMIYVLLYPSLQLSWKGDILVSRRPSVRLSVPLWTKSCPLCIFHNTREIHFIFAHLIKKLKKVCSVKGLLQSSKIWIFGNFF